ncbi:hypothetical protein PLEOSDRAFT_1108811 [Pleurotus ostreatus PC15]|uniref:FAS1 domain-containing protein n=1 Tax=Pleurotus ostreatus (strain PC15) TaxID=1137138 RepID=A0A067NHB5_PLEO1|nr:hypothetical protein PLEOSDRAFT_1108811 [Pleurotus ostreatus PC15]
MVKLSPLLYSAPFFFQLALADPLQDLCETLRSLGLKKLSTYISDVAAANTPTGQHFIGILSMGNAGPMTLFAPTDQAFDNFAVKLNPPERLASILSYHLVHGHFPLGIDDGVHDESFGAPLPTALPPAAVPGVNQPALNQPGVGGHQWQPGTNQPGINQPGVGGGQQWQPAINQPSVGQPGINQPGVVDGQQWSGTGQQWQGGEQQWNQGGQQGQPGANMGNPNVYASDQGQSPTDGQTPVRREESESPTPDLKSAIVGNPPIPYNTPNHVTIGRSTLIDSKYVMLEGKDRGQVVAWSNVTGTDGKTRMLNQDSDCPVLKSTKWKEIIINVVPVVLYIPGSLPQLLMKHKLVAFKAMLKETTAPGMPMNLLDALDASNGYGSHGFTIFAASDEAVMHAKEMIPAMTLNDPHAMATVMQNHIINGTTIYSPTLCSSTYPFYAIASSGGPLSFMVNNTGTFVTINHNDGGPIHSARILSTELLAHNGVVHVIDSILMSPYRDDNAAYAAYNQAAAMASQPFIPEQGPVGLPTSLPIGTGNGIGGGVVINAAQRHFDNLFNFGGWDLSNYGVVLSILTGIWFTTVPF